MGKLTPKQKKFVDEYCVDLNAAAAARRAGYRETNARQIGFENLTKPYIQKEIERSLDKAKKESGAATPEEVLAGYTRDIRFDPRRLFHPNGTTKTPIELDEEAALSLTGLEIFIRSDGSMLCKYKFPDKRQSRDSLAKYFGLFIEKHEHSVDVETIKMILSVLPDDVRNAILRRIAEKLNQ